MNKQTKNLLVLNASAGSGKTYRLVKTYLYTLLEDPKNPKAFSGIIAMTFTNKAALEMKTRILKKLDELGFPEAYAGKKDPLAEQLCSELAINEVELQHRAKQALIHILHQFEDFNVLTIDKFNLRLIRSFSKDLDLPQDFEVILNEDEIIEKIVDQILDQIGNEQQKSLTELVINYAQSNMDDDQKWEIRKSLIQFGKILSKEKDLALVEKLMHQNYDQETYKELKNTYETNRAIFINACKEAYSHYLESGMDPKKLPGLTDTEKKINSLASLTEIPEKLFSETFLTKLTDLKKGKYFDQEVAMRLHRLENLREELFPKTCEATIVRKHFFNMALLKFMGAMLSAMKKDEQLIRISEFNKLISDLVKKEDAPFIYERLGMRFQHYLLDEFQDTSRLQWLNMIPLIHESLSNNKNNLIVGDPKQSIYRFKNGLAEQFVELPKIYNPENDEKIEERSNYFFQEGKVEELIENWRSSATIVNFNNHIFELLKRTLNENSQRFYSSISQESKSGKTGRIEIVSQKRKVSEDELIAMLIDKIEACHQAGFNYGEICILTEKNKLGSIIAIALTQKGYQVVSSESLLLRNDPSIQLAISYLKRRLRPSSENEKKRFCELYFRLNSSDAFQSFRELLQYKKTKQDKTIVQLDDDRFLTSYFGGKENFYFHYESLYDLIQKLYRMLNWEELNNPFLLHLSDLIKGFEETKGPDLKSFLEYFETNGHNLSIQTSKNKDAIEIMSMHKSKGLEFPVVILPDIDLDIKIKTYQEYLIETNDTILYTKLNKNVPLPVVQEHRRMEEEQTLTDKVNLAYVAFTRPSERLIVFNFYSNLFGATMHNLFSEMGGVKSPEQEDLVIYDSGEVVRNTEPEIEKNTTPFEVTPLQDRIWFPDISLKNDPFSEENTGISERLKGTQLHILFSRMDGEKHIKKVLTQLISEGLIDQHFSAEFETIYESYWNNPEIQEIFRGALKISSEQDILSDRNSIVRPDKLIFKEKETIVMDFKTGLATDKHLQQVSSYKKTLERMGLPSVKGYLYYTAKNELTEVL